MVEMRWVVRTEGIPHESGEWKKATLAAFKVLQYRQHLSAAESAGQRYSLEGGILWSEWIDVPTVKEECDESRN